MTNLNAVFAKAQELNREIKSLIRLSKFEECDDLSCLEIDYRDAEQLLLLDELHSIIDKLSDVQDSISYLSCPIKETSRLHLNECGKYETKGGHYYSCGCGIEALVSDEYRDVPYWVRTRVEHDGNSYYLVGCHDVSLNGLTVRVRSR